MTDRLKNTASVKGLKLVTPRFLPPLDPGFRPAALANRAFQDGLAADGVPLVIGLERDNGKFSQFRTSVFPEGHPNAAMNFYYAERLVKFLLWQRGGFTVYVGGPASIGEHLQKCYSPGGSRHFDDRFMGEQVYERPFNVVACQSSEVPESNESGMQLGRHLDGCRIGFDLGASDRKVCAVIDGTVVYSEEVVWEPRKHSDPDYHYREIVTALQTAASKLPRVDAIGGSSAGIYVNNRPMVASLFRGVTRERYPEIRDLFLRIQREMNVPLDVINDGDVTALAGSMSLEDNGILGIAMGSSQAAGYVDTQGRVIGWLNELAFAPVDYSPAAPADEWSGDIGCGSQYFSQQCVFRLAPRAGISISGFPTTGVTGPGTTVSNSVTDAEKLASVQEKLAAGHEGAEKIWQSMGIYLGYALAHYADFYAINHVLILGRCTSGTGGTLILDGANQVLQNEFPELAARIQVQLPDERSRRVGQSIAAASLPVLSH